jgi:hypothetical protein
MCDLCTVKVSPRNGMVQSSEFRGPTQWTLAKVVSACKAGARKACAPYFILTGTEGSAVAGRGGYGRRKSLLFEFPSPCSPGGLFRRWR